MYYNKEMEDKMAGIEKTIVKEFDSRMELLVFSYIMEKGYDRLRDVTEEYIVENITEDMGMFRKDFLIAMTTLASKLCKEYEVYDLLTYTRMKLCMSPRIEEKTAWKNANGSYQIDLDSDEESVILYVVQGDEED